MKRIITALALLLFASGLAYGQAGYLDKTFGDGGVVTMDRLDDDEFGQGIQILSDGKILWNGYSYKYQKTNRIVIRRFESDGSSDSTFGMNGTVTFPYSSKTFEITDINKVVAYPDGAMLLYGCYMTESIPPQPTIMRLHANGDIDSSFGINGVFRDIRNSGWGTFTFLSIENDGQILALGIRGNNDTCRHTISNISSSGTLISSIALGINIVVGSAYNLYQKIYAGIDSNGMCLFSCSPINSHANMLVIRSDKKGVVDSTFGDLGVATASITDGELEFTSMSLLSDGSIVCLGNTGYYTDPTIRVVKFNYHGILDVAFGDYGVLSIDDTAGMCYGFDVIEAANNKIAIVGYRADSILGATSIIYQHLSDGRPDPIQPIFQFELNSEILSSLGKRMALQPDGKYLTTGSIYRYSLADYSSFMYRLDLKTKEVVTERLFNTPPSLHPTPSTDNCTVTYTLPTSGECTMTLLDESGRDVRTFATNQYRTAGEHKEELDLRGLAAGVYFLQIETGGTVQSAKLIKQ